MALSLSRAGDLASIVTRQTIYDLITNCTLTGTASATDIIVSHTMQITAVSLAPDLPTDASTLWYDLTHELLKVPLTAVGSSACSVWLSVGPDAWQVPVYNGNAYTLAAGKLCSYNTNGVEPVAGYTPNTQSPRDFLVAMRASSNIRGYAGVVQEDIAPGGFGPLTWYGFAYVDVDLGDVDTTLNLPAFLTLATNITGTALALTTQTPHNYPNIIGGVISHPTDAAGFGVVKCPCLLSGPWASGMQIQSGMATNASLL